MLKTHFKCGKLTHPRETHLLGLIVLNGHDQLVFDFSCMIIMVVKKEYKMYVLHVLVEFWSLKENCPFVW